MLNDHSYTTKYHVVLSKKRYRIEIAIAIFVGSLLGNAMALLFSSILGF